MRAKKKTGTSTIGKIEIGYGESLSREEKDKRERKRCKKRRDPAMGQD